MDICLTVAATGLLLARMPEPLTVAWVHSVEHTRIEEVYRVAGTSLRVTEVRVQGPAAGVEPPADARFTPEGWRYMPSLPALERVLLAQSGVDAVLALAACEP